MRPVILFRRGVDLCDQDEFEVAKKHMLVEELRSNVMDHDLVIGRYSVLPFYKELERDIENAGGQLINSYRQHQFVADIREWTAALGELTPRLYLRLQDLPEEGPFVLKGETNSKKHQWNTHMFARNRREAGEVYSRLRDDMLLASQEIYARDYVPLKKLAQGFNDLPISEEYRFFVLDRQVICGGFYWASHAADLVQVPSPDEVPRAFLGEAISRIGNGVRFYALDVARKADGGWMVVEVNDGQMSGLSCIDPNDLYSNLQIKLEE